MLETMKNTLLILIPLCLIISACNKEKYGGEVTNDPVFAQVLKSAPEHLTADNLNFELRTSLWRDFMPVAEENGSPLMAVNELIEMDSLAISEVVKLKKQYVIHEHKIWTTTYSYMKQVDDHVLNGGAKGGPKWGPGIAVDVVCEFEIAGQRYRILAKSQPIEGTS